MKGSMDWWRQEIEPALRQQGWTIEQTSTGGDHYRCLPPDKSKTPVFVAPRSGDPRTRHNILRDLRRAGFVSAGPEPESSRPQPNNIINYDPFEGDDPDPGDHFVSLHDLVGKFFRRTDRVDPRDPKCIAGVDFDKNELVLADRHQRKLRQPLREFIRDFRSERLQLVPATEADTLPDVTGMPFHEALKTLRLADGSSQELLATILGNRGLSGQAVSNWESDTWAPVKKHYDQLCIVFPGLMRAKEPNWSRPNADVPTGPRDSEPESHTETPSEPPVTEPAPIESVVTLDAEGANAAATLLDEAPGPNGAMVELFAMPNGEPVDYALMVYQVLCELHPGILEIDVSYSLFVREGKWTLTVMTASHIPVEKRSHKGASPNEAWRAMLATLLSELTAHEQALKDKAARTRERRLQIEALMR